MPFTVLAAMHEQATTAHMHLVRIAEAYNIDLKAGTPLERAEPDCGCGEGKDCPVPPLRKPATPPGLESALWSAEAVRRHLAQLCVKAAHVDSKPGGKDNARAATLAATGGSNT